MKNFKRKKRILKIEPLSGQGWSAFSEVPEGFGLETWINESERFHEDPPLRKKLIHFISYLQIFVKYRILHMRTSNQKQVFNEEYENDEEFSNTFARGLEIVEELKPQILEFYRRLVDKGRSEIVYLNRRIVYYRKDYASNPGYARYVENLDGTNKFEFGWGAESGASEQMIDSVLHQVGFECAQIEIGLL